jgi:hypothetical protein
MEDWKDIAKEWGNIPIDTYEFLFSQVKDRYEEVMSESESITKKAIVLTTITVGGFSGFAGFKFTSEPELHWVVLLCFFYVIDCLCLGVLLFPKEIIPRGSPPSEILINYLDDENLSETQNTALAYYQELRRYQDRIDTMKDKLSRRHKFYATALSLTILSIIMTSIVILTTIYHPSSK